MTSGGSLVLSAGRICSSEQITMQPFGQGHKDMEAAVDNLEQSVTEHTLR